jgi:hypothetical protein
VETAVLVVTGLGQFEAFINGRKVGDHVIDPGWTNYNKQVQYLVFDVGAYVKPGRNILGLSIGNGWYIGDKPDERHFMVKDEGYLFPGDKGYRPYGTCLAALAELRFCYADGQTAVIGTDKSWKTGKSATTTANVYGSEDFDARLWPEGWQEADFDDSGWPCAEELNAEQRPRGILARQTHPPVIVKEIIDPVSAVQCGDGILFDFGKNVSAIFEISVSGPEGSRIKMTPVEKLDNGIPIKTVETWCVYTLAGKGRETWKPSFSYSGGRWLFVEAEAVDGNKPSVMGSRAYRITSASPDVGTFHCSDDRYNKIFQIIFNSIESNLNHVHTDCPQIEKLGWLEATQLMAPSLMYNKDMRLLFRKILRDAREAQYAEGEYDVIPSGKKLHGPGLVPSIAPTYSKVITEVTADGLEKVDFVDTVAWGSCIVFLPVIYFDFYGDAALIQENYEACERYIRYIEGRLDHNGFLSNGLGDWGSPAFNERMTENIDTAIFYMALMSMARASLIIGKEDAAAHYESRADELRKRYNAAFLRKDSHTNKWAYMPLENWSQLVMQSCQAFPLYAGMVPEEYRQAIEHTFIESIKTEGIHCGEIALRFVIQMLDKLGQQELIGKIIMRKEHPSYLRFVEMGETTLPEYWRDDARSRNHDMLGHIMEWFYSGMAGITSAENSFKKINISPWMPEDMRELRCSYNSVRGIIALELQRTKEGLLVKIVVPDGSTAALDFGKLFVSYRIEGADRILQGGEYQMVVFDLGR